MSFAQFTWSSFNGNTWDRTHQGSPHVLQSQLQTTRGSHGTSQTWPRPRIERDFLNLSFKENNEEAPSFDLTSDKEFSKEREEGEGGKGVGEELLHQGNEF